MTVPGDPTAGTTDDVADELLAAIEARLSGGVTGVRLRDLVSREDLTALLWNRPPTLLDDTARWALAQRVVAGTAREVARIVGDPPADDVAALAAWVTAIGAASVLESSLFPEQQNLGDDGRAAELRVHYLRERNLLTPRGRDGRSVSGPQGEFPLPAPWPVSTSEPGPGPLAPWAWRT